MCVCVCVRARSVLSDPWESCSPPGSSVHGIFRQEHWRGLPFPSPGDLPGSRARTSISCVSCITDEFFTTEPSRKPQSSKLGSLISQPQEEVFGSRRNWSYQPKEASQRMAGSRYNQAREQHLSLILTISHDDGSVLLQFIQFLLSIPVPATVLDTGDTGVNTVS